MWEDHKGWDWVNIWKIMEVILSDSRKLYLSFTYATFKRACIFQTRTTLHTSLSPPVPRLPPLPRGKVLLQWLQCRVDWEMPSYLCPSFAIVPSWPVKSRLSIGSFLSLLVAIVLDTCRPHVHERRFVRHGNGAWYITKPRASCREWARLFFDFSGVRGALECAAALWSFSSAAGSIGMWSYSETDGSLNSRLYVTSTPILVHFNKPWNGHCRCSVTGVASDASDGLREGREAC